MKTILIKDWSPTPAQFSMFLQVFRTDFITAMKVPDSQTLPTGNIYTLSDTWRQEWEKGVQVISRPILGAPNNTWTLLVILNQASIVFWNLNYDLYWRKCELSKGPPQLSFQNCFKNLRTATMIKQFQLFLNLHHFSISDCNIPCWFIYEIVFPKQLSCAHMIPWKY